MTVVMSSVCEEIAGVVIADATVQGYPLTYVSPGFEQLTGYRAADMLGRSCGLLAGPETDPGATAVLREALAAGREAYVTLLNYRADGSTFWNEVALAPQHDASGRLVQYLGVQKDVTQRRAADARIHDLAYFDTLTRLANRAALHSELQRALRDARAGETELALLFVDLDDFKRVNDTYGHPTGDALLRHVAEALRAEYRSFDQVARYGGDEFVVILPNVRGPRADIAASRALTVLREIHIARPDGSHEGITVSCGVAEWVEPEGPAELLERADKALRGSKAAGKDGLVRAPTPTP